MTKRRMPISLEKLEHRLFLSASLTNTGRLIVTGDPVNANTISVGLSADGSSVNVVVDNRTVQTFDATQVKNLFILGGAGNDTISIDETQHAFTIAAKIFGGAGDDSITGGSGREYISGDAGNDTIVTGNGNATVYGGSGSDSIVAGSGTDELYGNGGADLIDSGSGGDLSVGGGGSNVLNGGSGQDTLVGGILPGQINTGSGDNFVISNTSGDQINIGTGSTTLAGNTADDQVVNNQGGSVTDSNVPPPAVPKAPKKSPPTPPPVISTVGTVTGTVTDQNGAPISGASIELCTTIGNSGGFSVANAFSTTTDANGDFTLNNIPAGSYVALAGKSSVGTISATVTVAAGKTLSLVLALQPFSTPVTTGNGAISGAVTDGQGNPVIGAGVQLVSQSAAAPSSGSGVGDSSLSALKTTTDANGNYSLPTVAAGSYMLVVVSPGAGYSQTQVSISANQTTTENVTISTAPPAVSNGGTVSGVFTDAQGNPVVKASVSLTNSSSGQAIMATTNGKGAFSITAPAGTYSLLAGKIGIGVASISDVVVVSGQTTTENPAIANPNPPPATGTVSGTVVDVNGNAVAGASLILSLNGNQYTATTAGDGTYLITATAGTFALSASQSDDGSANVSSVIVTDGQATTENITLPGPAPVTGTISGTILDVNGNPVAGASVVLAGDDLKYTATTASDGTYSITAPAGTYALSSSQTGDGSTDVTSIVVTNGHITSQNMSLPGPTPQLIAGAVSGKIVDANGNAVASAAVLLTGNGHQYTATTGSDGTYTVAAPSGTYTLTTSQTNDGSKSVTSVVVVNGQVTTENVALPGPAPAPTTGTISGKIVDANGNAAGGASVELTLNGTHYFATAASDGSYSTSLPGGTYLLTASATNDGSKTISLVIVNGQNTTENISLPTAAPTTGTVSGKISDVNGNPVAGASITLTSGGTTYTATTASNGSYTLAVPGGAYALIAAQSNDGTTSVSSVAVVNGQTTTENVALPGPQVAPTTGTITGTITDVNGNPVSGALISVTAGGNTYTATTIVNGSYNLTAPAGIYGFTASQASDGSTALSGVVVINGQSITENVALPGPTQPNGAVSGVITDSHGNAIAFASVSIFAGSTDLFTATDGNGNYSFTVPAGTYEITANSFGIGTTTVNGVVVSSGKTTTENVTIQATPTTGAVSGKITDSNGNAVNGASITLSSGGNTYTATSGSGGTYSVTTPGGTYTLVATQTTDGTTTVNSVVVVNGQTTTENVALPSAAPTTGIVSGKVTDSNGNAAGGASITLTSGGNTYTATTNSSGNYTVTAPGGTYTLVATQTTDGTTTVNSVVVTNGQTTTENVALPSAAPTTGIVSGKVTDSNGNAAGGASITLTSGGNTYTATTNGSGNYSVTAPGGTYTLVATQTTDGTTTVNSVVVTNGQTTTENVALPSAAPTTGIVSGKVTDSNGNAAGGASITLTSGGNTYTATTNGSGNYSVTAPGGTYTLVATQTTDGTTTVNNVVIINGQTTTKNVALPSAAPTTGTVTGKVTDINGNAVSGASVVLTSGGNTYTATTNSSGVYAVTASGGTYSLVASLTADGSTTMNNVTVTNGQSTTANIALPGPTQTTGTITGKVTGTNGAGISFASVSLFAGNTDLITVTDGNGMYSFTVAAGTYEITANSYGIGSNTIAGIAVYGGQTTTENIQIPAPPSTGVVSGKVIDSAGNAAPNAGITLTGGGNTFTISADATGAYNLIASAGTYAMSVTQPIDGTTNISSVVVNAGQTTTENVSLPSAPTTGTVSGKVTNITGATVSGASVTFTSGGNVYTATTASDGTYSLTLPGGTYTVVGSQTADGSTTVTNFVVTNGKAFTENIALPGPVQALGAISGTITDSNGNPIAYASVSIFSGNTDEFTATDSNGQFSLTGPAGVYQVTANEFGIGSVTVNGVIVVGGQTTTQNIQL